VPADPPARKPPLGPELENIANAYAAATGNGAHELDIMNAPLG
jgi:hypothetical protein